MDLLTIGIGIILYFLSVLLIRLCDAVNPSGKEER